MKGPFKAIVSDFDGTLAGSNNKVSLPVQKAIQKWLAAGYQFSIVTGKSYSPVIATICEELGLTAPQITDGGAEIIDPVTHKILHSEYIDEKKAHLVIDRLLANNIDFMVRKDEAIFIHLVTANVRDYLKVFKPADISALPNYKDIGKIRIFVHKNLNEIIEFLVNNIYPVANNLHIVRSDTINSQGFDITSSKANKKLAVQRLESLMHISPKEMVAIGDGYNDVNLFGVCGYHIAMGHSPQELKDLAEYVAPSIDEDGVAAAIEMLLNMS